LPLELVYSIVDSVHSRSGVLSLALTCRFFKDRLIPNVLDYREINVPPNALTLWNHLNDNSSLLRHGRVFRFC
ncbi:hypothetical protein JAAARDRAFT_100613, partial [Jaapia argillacea MUCL 33604]